MDLKTKYRASIYIDLISGNKTKKELNSLLRIIKKTILRLHEGIEIIAVTEFEEPLKYKKQDFEVNFIEYPVHLSKKHEYTE